jgi:hypothetical protein
MKKFILLSLLITTAFYAHSASIIGGEITQTCLGGTSFQTNIELVNDCAGSNAPDSVEVHYQCLTQASLSFTSWAHQVPGTGIALTGCFHTGPTTCDGGTHFGCKAFVYQNNITLNNTKDWKIWIRVSGRGSNHSNSATSNDNFYLELIQNLSLTANNSTSTYANRSMTRVIMGQSFCYNHGSIDPDGDSLSYSLVNPLIDSTTILPYNFPYSPTYFLPSQTPITIDPITGDICINSTMEFSGITKVKIEEWRNFNGQRKLIATSHRELYFKSIYWVNQTPTLSGMDFSLSGAYNPNDTTYLIDATIGDTIHFHINGYDPDTFEANTYGNKEIFTITWNNGIPSGYFTPHSNGTDSAYAEFYWIPQAGDLTPGNPYHCFTATIQDDGCPYNASQTFSYCILIKDTVVGIESTAQQDQNTQLTVFPNPAHNQLNIITEKEIKDVEVRVMDINGKIILQQNQAVFQSLAIDITTLKKGCYIISINYNEFYYYNKFIKQ